MPVETKVGTGDHLQVLLGAVCTFCLHVCQNYKKSLQCQPLLQEQRKKKCLYEYAFQPWTIFFKVNSIHD